MKINSRNMAVRRIVFGVGLIMAGIFVSACENSASKDYNYSTWNTYAGTKDGSRYSSNSEINIDNVKDLQVAWTYSTNDKDSTNRSQIQCNPIIVDGVLYGTSPRLKLFALDAATGENKWVFDPNEEGSGGKINYGISRGVVYWEDENGNDKRILYGVNSRLYAIDASDGTPISGFGENGSIDLRKNLDREKTEKKAFYAKTPGVIYKDLLIMGMSVSEKNGALPGHIRAFDVRTGERRWIFHTIPHPGEYGYDSWEDKDAWRKIGGANSWAGMALDEGRGIVYVPTGSAAPDMYGGFRKGANLFANSLLALDAATGEYIWHYQIVHHDLWDRDLPASPNLVTLKQDGKEIDAIAQITKQGYTFLFDRTNGKPIFPIEEKPVPQDALPGEKPWPTQPIPTKPEPFARQKFEPEDVSDISPETHKELMVRYNKIKHREPFTPPSKEGGWIFPGFDGGGEWGGAAVDVESQILYVNSSELPWSQVMVDVKRRKKTDNSIAGRGSVIYNRNCLSCHGEDLQGSGASYPSLVSLNKKYNEQQVREFINTGGNRMPSFEHLPEEDKDVLIAFLLNLEESNATAKAARHALSDAGGAVAENISYEPLLPDEVPYTMTGYNRFLDKNGYPGIKPPWGTLNAVDLNSGEILWKVPLGEYPELTERGIPITGTENYGGPVVTKGGLVFIAATKDEMIRAFDKNTGEELWQAELPAAGYATPATYEVNGKQYVVIACGGGKIGSKSGDTYVAFALPPGK
jgi:quinoprotein glucose dehydrogenase